MTASVDFTDDAVDDLLALDRSVQGRVLKKLLLLQDNVHAGAPLGNKGGLNLAGFRKLVVGDRQWRVVYRPNNDESGALVWVIGSRTDEECYVEADARVKQLGDHPIARPLAEVLDLLGSVRRTASDQFRRLRDR